MLHSEMTWVSSDGLKLCAQEWRPNGAPHAAVALVHGLGEHSGRYAHVADKFTAAGISMLGIDLRGHGRSEGVRGHFPSYAMVMDDITCLLDEVKQRNPGVPLFLYGHSLGGALVLYYGITQNYDLHGIIATSPGLATGSPVSPVTLTLGKIMYTLVPTFTLPNGLDFKNLSHVPAVQTAYVGDPLVHTKISARLGLDLINNGRWIVDHAAQFHYPLLLLQGDADHLVSPEATRQFAAQVRQDITFHMYEGMYHELHNETIKDEVINMMIEWISSH